MVFHQNGITMTYWADENTNWSVSGVVSNSINPFWIVTLTIPLVAVWNWLRRRDIEPSTPAKMAMGMFFTSLAFLILFIAAKSGGDQTFTLDAQGQFVRDPKTHELMSTQHQVSPLWLITAYMMISLGELMLSPMGLSLVSKVAPARMRGLMMGGWFVATAIGNKLTVVGTYWTEWYHSSFWLFCSLCALGMAFVLLLLLRPLKKAMPGV
jgi:POT family proton-dependent oligopeptide transporter